MGNGRPRRDWGETFQMRTNVAHLAFDFNPQEASEGKCYSPVDPRRDYGQSNQIQYVMSEGP